MFGLLCGGNLFISVVMFFGVVYVLISGLINVDLISVLIIVNGLFFFIVLIWCINFFVICCFRLMCSDGKLIYLLIVCVLCVLIVDFR